MKEYKVGYVAGVFDLFHLGHLNLMRNAKTKCDYLIAGVLEDDLVIHFKGKAPFIPHEERMDIVGACRYVDKVVPVDFSNIAKMDAWKKNPYDCFFSGNDYEGNPVWEYERKQLNEVGSDIYFFPYTQSTSSTQIKRALKGHDGYDDADKRNLVIDFCKDLDKLYIYGAGKYGQEMAKFLYENAIRFDGYMVSDITKLNQPVKDHPVFDVDAVRPDERTGIIMAMKEEFQNEVRPQLKEKGFDKLFNVLQLK
ncbi:adenylyltransferase/cytidyltransferase family protein [Butyrivibrio sp. WCD2001]|uniref:adenylyltransferase/cytidyltransferase family protein n=1 Tax=Butyrivibrio sp. WCD2001 TaxID=1280681 RepID=UPI0003FC6A89|nr:adenylyltransferase/cytidyltransferase family protein [Butyrivibrio sp. WCD2001]